MVWVDPTSQASARPSKVASSFLRKVFLTWRSTSSFLLIFQFSHIFYAELSFLRNDLRLHYAQGIQSAMFPVVLSNSFRPGAHFWSSVRRERRKWPMPLFRFFAVSGRTERDRKLKIRGNGTYFSQRSRNRSRKSISTYFFFTNFQNRPWAAPVGGRQRHGLITVQGPRRTF
uniref:Uncharacterized protein n=1 Tax=Cacopsylla melanoneura TaxID=428564 RepID=A0A8D8R2U7_9HEMI